MSYEEIRHAEAVLSGLKSVDGLDGEAIRRRMQPAWEAAKAELVAQVDPTGELQHIDPVEFERRLKAARKLRMAELGLRSARARASRREAEMYTALAKAEAEVS
jgi:hypothetical protein